MEDDTKRMDVMLACYSLIDICDEVWVYGDSEGCLNEARYAKNNKKRVVYKQKTETS